MPGAACFDKAISRDHSRDRRNSGSARRWRRDQQNPHGKRR
nr:MAG TPA: hypothetical protein [Caudoviricetes sp.]